MDHLEIAILKEILQYMLDRGHDQKISLNEYIQDTSELLKPFLAMEKQNPSL